MNMRLSILFCLLPILVLGNNGCGHKVRFTVVDERGAPIENVTVSITYQKGFIPGEGFGRDLKKNIRKQTSSHGIATFRIIPFGNNRFGYSIRDTEGRYYRDIGERSVRYEDKDCLTERKITLRAKQNPIALFSSRHYSLDFPIADDKAVSFREPVGFDAVVGDWVAPYGKGKIADFLFRSYYKEDGIKYLKDDDGRLMLNPDFKCAAAFSWTFTNTDDGIVEAPRHWPTSVIPVEMFAPEDGYQKELRMEWHHPQRPTDSQDHNGRQYFFRIRTQRNREGKIIYALYGKLLEEPLFGSLSFEDCQFFNYDLNPTPMDRNLESNGENLNEKAVLRAHVNADYIRRFPSVLLNQSEYMRSLPTLAEEEARKKKAASPSP